eukprot:4435649-Amphidinium_carterae.2
MAVSAMRREARDLMRQADPERVDRCAALCRQSREDYIASVVKKRWGTSLDFQLIADAVELPCDLINQHNGEILYDGRAPSGKQKSLVAYKNHNFTLCRQPRRPPPREGYELLAYKRLRRCSGKHVRGGAPKRPYPFGPHADTAVLRTKKEKDEQPCNSETEKKKRRQSKDDSNNDVPTVVLVCHGSFAPMHAGYKEAVARALPFLPIQGVYVQKTVVGCTTSRQVEQKTEDMAFADVKLRAETAKEVLQEGQPTISPFIVDDREYSTAYALAMRREEKGHPMLYLVGSDLMKRPSSQTLIVTRTRQELQDLARSEFYSILDSKGLCCQKKMLGVTSTKVRKALEERRIPLMYSERAQALIRQALGWPKKKMKTVKAQDTSVIQTTVPSAVPGAASGSNEPIANGPRQTGELEEERAPLPRRVKIVEKPSAIVEKKKKKKSEDRDWRR